jgi:hypothetical protein
MRHDEGKRRRKHPFDGESESHAPQDVHVDSQRPHLRRFSRGGS